MSIEQNEIHDDRFLGRALSAFLQVAFEQGAMPDVEVTRPRAYDLYDNALRTKNAAIASPTPEP
jgi:hypothetical protein